MNIDAQIEGLALAVAKGFEQMHSHFTQIEQRLDFIETHMDALGTRMDAFETRMDSLDTRVAGGFRDVRTDIHDLRELAIPLPEQEELWRRIDRIEKHLGLAPKLG